MQLIEMELFVCSLFGRNNIVVFVHVCPVQCFVYLRKIHNPTVNLFQATEIDSTIGFDFVHHLEMDPIGMSTPRKSKSHANRSCRRRCRRIFTDSDSSYSTPAETHSRYFPDVKNKETSEMASKYREPVHYATESNTSDTDSPCWTDQEVELYQDRHNPKERRMSGLLQKGGGLINNRTKVPSQALTERIARNRKVNRNNRFNQARKNVNKQSEDDTLIEPPAGNSLQESSRGSGDSFELNNDLTFLFQEQNEEKFDEIVKQTESKAPFDVTAASPNWVKSLFGSSKIFYGATPFHSRRLPKVKRTFCRKSSIRLSSKIRLSRKFRKSKIPKFDDLTTLAILMFMWSHPTLSLRVSVIILAILFLANLMFKS